MKNEKWYSLEELASLCGLETKYLKGGASPLKKLSIAINSDTRLGGYHNTEKLYSENVLKALKEYQLKNSAGNAVKNKEAVISGNVSVIQNQTVKQAITSLLDNPESIQMLLNESLARTQKLGIENKKLKDIIEIQTPKAEYYDDFMNSENLIEIGHLGKVTKIGDVKIFKRLLDDKVIKARFEDKVKCYDPCYGFEKYFESRIVVFMRDGEKCFRDKLLLNANGYEFFRKKYSKGKLNKS